MKRLALVLTALAIGSLTSALAHAQARKSVVTYATPFAYCAAVGTIDRPGPSYRGPASPTAVVRAAGGSPASWRCLNGRVLACYEGASGRACQKMRVSRIPHSGIREACRDNPNTSYVANAYLGDDPSEWRCRNGVPQLVSTPQLDARGFFPASWRDVPAPSTAHAAATISTDRQRPTPEELRAWYASGPAHGYTCVVMAKKGAAFYRQMNGALAGQLAYGKDFIPASAAYDRARRIWYRVDFIYQSRLKGWVHATDVICDQAHFG